MYLALCFRLPSIAMILCEFCIMCELARTMHHYQCRDRAGLIICDLLLKLIVQSDSRNKGNKGHGLHRHVRSVVCRGIATAIDDVRYVWHNGRARVKARREHNGEKARRADNRERKSERKRLV